MRRIDQRLEPKGNVTSRRVPQDLTETKPQNTIFPQSFYFFMAFNSNHYQNLQDNYERRELTELDTYVFDTETDPNVHKSNPNATHQLQSN